MAYPKDKKQYVVRQQIKLGDLVSTLTIMQFVQPTPWTICNSDFDFRKEHFLVCMVCGDLKKF